MRRNAIDFKTLLRITEEFCKEKGLDKEEEEKGKASPLLYVCHIGVI